MPEESDQKKRKGSGHLHKISLNNYKKMKAPDQSNPSPTAVSNNISQSSNESEMVTIVIPNTKSQESDPVLKIQLNRHLLTYASTYFFGMLDQKENVQEISLPKSLPFLDNFLKVIVPYIRTKQFPFNDHDLQANMSEEDLRIKYQNAIEALSNSILLGIAELEQHLQMLLAKKIVHVLQFSDMLNISFISPTNLEKIFMYWDVFDAQLLKSGLQQNLDSMHDEYSQEIKRHFPLLRLQVLLKWSKNSPADKISRVKYMFQQCIRLTNFAYPRVVTDLKVLLEQFPVEFDTFISSTDLYQVSGTKITCNRCTEKISIWSVAEKNCVSLAHVPGAECKGGQWSCCRLNNHSKGCSILHQLHSFDEK